MSSRNEEQSRPGARSLPTRQSIVELIAQARRALHTADIAARLSVPDGSRAALLRMLDDMVMGGVLLANAGQHFALAAPEAYVPKKGLPLRTREAPKAALREAPRAAARPDDARAAREGFVSITPRGAGFVASLGAPGDDVFVPRECIGGAMHGDRVEVTVIARGARGPEGTILKIIERGTKRVAGVLRRRGRSAWLEPDDTRIRGPIILSATVDTTGPEGNSGEDGDAAVASISRYPLLPDENPEGVLEAVLGRPGELSVEIKKVLVTEQIEELHSEAAVAEAEAYGLEVPAEMLVGREDLTHLPLPTIDPEDARDHDDAVWVERTNDGGYTAWIAIADVSSYVRPGTKIDEESLARGCSVYLPSRAIPMLPRALSSNLCSLLPDVIRLCLCAEVTLDAGGNVRGERLIRGFMNSRAKLTYGGVARALGYSELPEKQEKAEEMVDGLKVAAELSRMLRSKRMKRGAMDFELPEAKIILNDEGQPVDVERRAQDAGVKKAYQLIEELMLLANEVVARWLVAKESPTVFRVHPAPDQKKLEKFIGLCGELSIQVDADIALDAKKLSTLLKSLADHPKAAVLNMLLLRSMKQAAYDVTNLGHFGLASKAYVHFTSPIRRYPDLVVHRAVHGILSGQKIDRSDEAKKTLAEAALTASKNERRAMEVEREIGDLYRAYLMRDKVGARYEGTVTGLAGGGIYVALDSPFVDVMVKFDALGGSGWELDDTGLRATGGNGQEVKLGDRLLVEIIDVAILRRTVYARRISGGGDDPARGKRSRERGAEGPAKGAPGAKAAKRDVRAKVRKVESRKGGAGKTGGKSKGGGKRKR
jgi:ribonuclease R